MSYKVTDTAPIPLVLEFVKMTTHDETLRIYIIKYQKTGDDAFYLGLFQASQIEDTSWNEPKLIAYYVRYQDALEGLNAITLNWLAEGFQYDV